MRGCDCDQQGWHLEGSLYVLAMLVDGCNYGVAGLLPALELDKRAALVVLCSPQLLLLGLQVCCSCEQAQGILCLTLLEELQPSLYCLLGCVWDCSPGWSCLSSASDAAASL